MAEFKVGEIVDITITGAQVIGIDGGGIGDLEVSYSTDLGIYEAVLAIDTPAVNVARVTPAGWPPRPGDLWKDGHGSFWFAFWGADACEVFMVPSDPARGELNTPMPDRVRSLVGPLTLVHREERGEATQ